MDVCDRCVDMGTNDNCDNCSFGNPCLGCPHDKNNDCNGQCYNEGNDKEELHNGNNQERETQGGRGNLPE